MIIMRVSFSFIDTIRYGPSQHHDWKKVCEIVRADSSRALSIQSDLRDSKILVVFGESDDIVLDEEVSQDLQQLLHGSEHLEIRMVPGTHGFPLSSSKDVVNHIREFWGL